MPKSRTEKAADLVGVKTGVAAALVKAISDLYTSGQYLPAGICAILLAFDLLAIWYQLKA